MNQDYRSYSLNFEAIAVFYDKKIAREMQQIFLTDAKDCIRLTPAMVDNWSHWLAFKQSASRLLSPIL